MTYPSQPQYTPGQHYTPAGGSQPPRRSPALIGGVVIACTTLLLGSILLVAFMVNRGDAEDSNVAAEKSASTEADESSEEISEDPTDDGESGGDEGGGESTGDDRLGDDAGEVAIVISEILMGASDQSSQGLVCSSPGLYLIDPELIGETMADEFGELASLLDEFTIGETVETAEGVSVEVLMVVFGTESPFATVDLVQEDGSWKACDLVLHEDY